MKVIDGGFGKDDSEADDLVLAEKIMVALEEVVGVESRVEGSFVMIVEDDQGMAKIATDLDAANMIYLMEFIKASVLMSTVEEGAIH